MKISVVTVCYNSEKTIEDTIKSVLMQNYDNYEHIFIDGKSRDNTLKIINKYKSKYKNIIIVCEKDKGLYDAMNKGISLATGDIIGILNSDDVLANKDVFSKIINTFENNDCMGIFGNLLMVDNSLNKINRVWKSKKGNYKLGWHPAHPTLYLKKEVYNNIGKFNLDYRICADYDFMLRLMKNNYSLCFIDDYIVYMREGGVSTNGLKGYLKNFKEAVKVCKNNSIKFPYFINCLRSIKTIIEMIKSKFIKNNILK